MIEGKSSENQSELVNRIEHMVAEALADYIMGKINEETYKRTEALGSALLLAVEALDKIINHDGNRHSLDPDEIAQMSLDKINAKLNGELG